MIVCLQRFEHFAPQVYTPDIVDRWYSADGCASSSIKCSSRMQPPCPDPAIKRLNVERTDAPMTRMNIKRTDAPIMTRMNIKRTGLGWGGWLSLRHGSRHDVHRGASQRGVDTEAGAW